MTFFIISEFCKQLDVKKRQAFEHELRRLRREGDETIAIHASAIKTTKEKIYLKHDIFWDSRDYPGYCGFLKSWDFYPGN